MMPTNQAKTQKLVIMDSKNVLENIIRFSKADSVNAVLSKIRAERNLGPNVQINIIKIQGPEQAVLKELEGKDLMWDHFPQGGNIRIQTKETEDTRRISHNVAQGRAKFINVIAIQGNKKTKASIEENEAGEDARMKNFITDQKVDMNLDWD